VTPSLVATRRRDRSAQGIATMPSSAALAIYAARSPGVILAVMNKLNTPDSRAHEGAPESWPRSVAVLVRQVLFALREVEKGGWAHLEQIAGVRKSLQREYQRQRPNDAEFVEGADL
jgi:hypothetical protein